MKLTRVTPHLKFYFAVATGLAVLPGFASIANATDASPTPQKKSASQAGTGHGKNLNFDGDYVETMGKNSLDSLTALSESQKDRDSHLYRKRAEFAPETAETLKQSRFEQ